jgi:serine/threonine protein phosphatase PrpC
LSLFQKLFGHQDEVPCCGHTDVGRRRDTNEDAFAILNDRQIYIVADGMGGHNAGEVASAEAIRGLTAYFTPERVEDLKQDPPTIPKHLETAFLEVNQRVFTLGQENSSQAGMGCALVMALVHDGILHTCHVGDVRAYVCNRAGLVQITNDHTEVANLVRLGQMTPEEAHHSPLKSILTQAIGSPVPIDPEYHSYVLETGDRVLVCSDGLWGMVPDQEIWTIVTRGKRIAGICQELIDQANAAGGKDNITAVVFQI